MKTPDVSGIRLPFVRQQQFHDGDIYIMDQHNRFVAKIDHDMPPYTRAEHADFIVESCNNAERIKKELEVMTAERNKLRRALKRSCPLVFRSI